MTLEGLKLFEPRKIKMCSIIFIQGHTVDFDPCMSLHRASSLVGPESELRVDSASRQQPAQHQRFFQAPGSIYTVIRGNAHQPRDVFRRGVNPG